MAAKKRKKLKRKDRLKAAKKWGSSYRREDLVKAYSKRFGTNKVCAIQELQILGRKIDKEYRLRVFREHQLKCEEAKRKKEMENEEEVFNPDQDGEFYFIAGYTSGGAAYGITWEQYENEIKVESDPSDSERFEDDSDEEIPF
ncbi:MAG: hypothetical protein U9N10_02835 [Bacillota bacterium]|nr:hypothetical protein [Bacillota bacterium]